MEGAINVTVSPLQIVLALAFQIWIVVFPIILIRKVNYLTALLQEQIHGTEQSPQSLS